VRACERASAEQYTYGIDSDQERDQGSRKIDQAVLEMDQRDLRGGCLALRHGGGQMSWAQSIRTSRLHNHFTISRKEWTGRSSLALFSQQTAEKLSMCAQLKHADPVTVAGRGPGTATAIAICLGCWTFTPVPQGSSGHHHRLVLIVQGFLCRLGWDTQQADLTFAINVS
jgi:hypothetical protein